MIKFRVWDKLTQKYWNIENWHFEDEYLDLIEPGVSICDPRIERIWRKQGDVEIMQFTGLKDVNGNDIYDGDIVRCKNEYQGTDYTGKVVFFNGGFCVWTGGFRNYVWEDMIPEIIGNVHTNHELLED